MEKTAITFEYEVPSVEEFRGRIENTLQHYPYLVAEDETGILGYAYAGRFQTRAAYDWAVETSIYIRMDQKRRGLGRILYDALEEGLKEQGILNVNACIACTAIRRTSTSPMTASIFTSIWAIAWWENFISAAINFTAGTIWSGWSR